MTITEQHRSALGQERLSVRLGRGYKQKLQRLARAEGLSVQKWLEAEIDRQIRKAER